MAYLISFLSTGKGTWGHVSRLIEEENWEKVFLLTNEYGEQNFKANKNNVELIRIDEYKGIRELRDEIIEKLKEKIKDTEVGVNFVSGSGKEHMALVGALIRLGLGFRLMALTQDGVKEI